MAEVTEEIVQKAFDIARTAHKVQVDKARAPYILHPIAVAERLDSNLEKVVAYLHDVIEDTEYTFDDLRTEGIPEEAIQVLKVLTHDKLEPYSDYISRIKMNPTATKVKLEDLRHNSQLDRLPNITAEDVQRVMKYKAAIRTLKNEL